MSRFQVLACQEGHRVVVFEALSDIRICVLTGCAAPAGLLNIDHPLTGPCKHCEHSWEDHVTGLICLFSPTRFEKMSPEELDAFTQGWGTRAYR